MEPQVFSPGGGMNQDDSIITPTAKSAGHNAFQQGDYRYALNARIGSSRSDNFGDVENIKGTTEKTAYNVRSVVNNNSDFASQLTGWSQIAVTGGTDWSVVLGSVTLQPVANDFISSILYQAISTTSKRIGLRLKFSVNDFTSNFSTYIVFLNGTTILSTQLLVSGSSDGDAVNDVYSRYINVELPTGCNGIGFQMAGVVSLGFPVDMENFQFFDWASGSRPSGTERVIGKREDKETNRLYYFVYNSSNNHCIRYYDPVTATVYELLKWSGLNFASTHFISSDIIDNYLGFTHRENPPRLIDVNSVSDTYLILGSDFREYHISFHRWAPTMPPIQMAYYDGVVNNYLKFEGKVFQFSHRYILYDNTKTRFSPISVASQHFVSGSGSEITSIQIQIPGFTLDDPSASTEYNYFNNDSIKFTAFVSAIEIAYRESSTDLWRIFKRYYVKDDNNGLFYFEADADSTPVSTSDFFQLFDTVPIRAGCIQAIDNRFVFADILEEEEQAMIPQVTDVGVAKFDATQPLGSWWNEGFSDPGDNAATYSGMDADDADELGQRARISDTTFKGRGIYKLAIQYLSKTGWRTAGYTTENWRYEIDAEATILDKFYALQWKFPSSFRPPSWAVAYQIMRTNVLNIDYFLFGSANSFMPLIDDTGAGNDAGEVNEELRSRIRQHIEDARSVAGLTKELPKVLLGKNIFRSLVSQVRKTTSSAITLANASRIYIDVNNWYNASKANAPGTQNNPINKLFYNYREGDRVRFIGSTNAAPTDNQKVVYDVLILEFTGRGIVIEKPVGIAWVPDDTANTDARDWMIEVYTPKTPSESDDYLYHETGEWYPVLYPGTESRDFAKRDWTYTNNAAMTCETYGDFRAFIKRPFSYGDCHGILKTFYNDDKTTAPEDPSVYTCSMNPDPNKSWDVWEKCIGRSAPAYTDLPVVKYKTTQVRFGGQIIEESFVNQITRFRQEDEKIFPSEYGRIRALINTANAQVESVGAILLVIGERETFSIYVNRTTLEDLSGRSQVALSERVLGSYNTLLGSHGTLNPESVSVERGRVYFWDAVDGTWIRYGRDGLTEISFYKMRNWFRELGELLITQYESTPPVVLSEFDPYNEELITTINHSSLPATFRGYSNYKGVLFSEEDKRWKSAHNYLPEMFGKINNQVIAFVGGALYTLETNSTRSTFFDTKYDVMIEPVFNTNPKDMKTWENLAVISSHKWSLERLISEYRGSKTKRESRLALSAFEEVEDGYFSAIKKDINTPVVENPIINGDYMRSKAVKALFKLDPSVTSESLLHYVVMNQIDSPKNV